ncbi:Hypothetical protein NocV09_00901150 [Nannochloropsis oceanica]
MRFQTLGGGLKVGFFTTVTAAALPDPSARLKMTPNTSVFQDLRAAAADLLAEQQQQQPPETRGAVHIDHQALDRLAARLSLREVRSKVNRVGLPLKFARPMDELNFHAMLALLSFGGAYDGGNAEHPRMLAESARDTVLFGLIGLHLSKADMHAGFLLTVTRSDVSSYFGIDGMVSVPHESMPAIHVERPGPLCQFVNDLVWMMNQVGERLKELGEPDLAHFILSSMRGEGVPTAARLVTALDVAFPTTFGAPLPLPRLLKTKNDDKGFVCHKKSLMLVSELYHRLRHTFSDLAFQDFTQAPGYVTPAIITHLIRLGVLHPTRSQDEDDKADAAAGASMMGKPDRVAPLTAAAILAVDGLALRLAEGATEREGGGSGHPDASEVLAPLDLSYYLDDIWSKEDGQEQVQRQQQQQVKREDAEQLTPKGEEQEPQTTQQQKGVVGGLNALTFVPPQGQTVM